jgi:hypothetical protein
MSADRRLVAALREGLYARLGMDCPDYWPDLDAWAEDLARRVAALAEPPADALYQWGVSDSGVRHAFRLGCGACSSREEHRRNHKPHSLCGTAWAPDWPVVDVYRLRTCGTCVTLAARKGEAR